MNQILKYSTEPILFDVGLEYPYDTQVPISLVSTLTGNYF